MSTFPGSGSHSPHWGRVTQSTLPRSISANWGWSKIVKVKVMTSVAGKGPVETIFIFCCTHAIYSSPGFKILTEQPGKAERRAFISAVRVAVYIICLVFLYKLIYSFFRVGQDFVRTFLSRRQIWMGVGQGGRETKHYCSWPPCWRIYRQFF